MTRITLTNEFFRAEIALLGAELVRLQDSTGADWLHDGDPAWWSGRAPILFPMVGRAVGDHIRVDGQLFPLPQHGFARRSTFSVVEAGRDRAVLSLGPSGETLVSYPFAFRLDIAYALAGATLNVVATVANEDEKPLPFSLGFHPAFRWPLPGGKGVHEVRFERAEPAPIRRLTDGLLDPQEYKNPAASGVLALEPGLFEAGALIFEKLQSRRVAFGPPGGPEVAASFPDMPHFGLWTKPGAPFLCLEPWQGFAAPLDFDGAFAQRPGVLTLAPGEQRRFVMDITLKF
ncbi:aldose 1-epimerase family protein [Rhodoblastus acidophilus]|uniref:Aldose 1-epimerase family protein n=1 Tax=Rhodoblastus acidophilus TaxID=1074 RepID=A0A6N8DKW3_RHOAC|nr:aldose 1-epimerase family protein [Rhodoblastus acidophilus]MCW2274335.1 galactose mutarotase-like enzyme [Rhodoblastus acidophilus]MTV31212.1 aldose 1-epimerase family protein [Rhodoblastus acidophilus]